MAMFGANNKYTDKISSIWKKRVFIEVCESKLPESIKPFVQKTYKTKQYQ